MPAAKSIRTMSQAEYAGHRKVTRKTVTKWKQAGHLILTATGQVDVDATDLLMDERPECYRGGVTSPGNQSAGNTSEVTPSPDDDDNLSLADAVRRKENYLGLLRKRELEISDGEWARVEDIGAQLDAENAMVRERLLGLPGKLGGILTPQQVSRLDAEIREVLTDLSNGDEYRAMIDARSKQVARRK